MLKALPEKKATRRDPASSRQALIDATLDAIAEIGLAETTVSHIIERAGLSRGMVHLHFGGKDKLVTAAAEFFSDQYYAELERQLGEADTSPEATVMAVVQADLSPALLNERSTRIWHAFRGAAHAHAGIARYSNTQDERLTGILLRAFTELSGGNGQAAHEATFGTVALLEGMWVHYLSDMEAFSRQDAAKLIRKFLAGLIPGTFA